MAARRTRSGQFRARHRGSSNALLLLAGLGLLGYLLWRASPSLKMSLPDLPALSDFLPTLPSFPSPSLPSPSAGPTDEAGTLHLTTPYQMQQAHACNLALNNGDPDNIEAVCIGNPGVSDFDQRRILDHVASLRARQ